MRIKTITAENMAAALAIIRDQLGPEALILGTRKVTSATGQPTLEITAALNDPEPVSPALPAPAVKPVPTADAGQAATLAATLAAHGTPPELSERLQQPLPGLQQAGFAVADGLDMLLGKLLPLKPFTELMPKGRIHVFVGPTGAGKTTLIGKLALQQKQQGVTVGLMSLDDQKIAGFEPLAVAAEALGEQAHLIHTPADLQAAAKALGPRQLMLLDTPGLNPYHRPSMLALQQRLAALNLPLTLHVVLPAYLHGPALALLPVAFQPLSPSSLIFTKLDETPHWGPLAGTLAAHNIAGGMATNSPDLSTAPVPLTPRLLAEVLTTHPRHPWEIAS